METNVRYTVAGAFVLLMTTLIILSVIWLSSGFSNEKFNNYVVYMKEPISGLKKDSPVEFNGVEVGKIDDAILNKDNPQVVALILKIKDKTPVTMGTRAKLGVKMLSGTNYLLLEDKGTDKRPLLAKKGQPYPVIETTPSIIVKMDKIMTQMSDSFRSMSESFKSMSSSISSLFSRENIQAIKRVLQKLGG